MKQEEINKIIIRDFYRRAVGQGEITFAEEIIADNYIQHSPMVKPGKAGLLEALQYMKQMPKPATTSTPFMRLIAEGNYVVTNLSFGWGDEQKAVIDLFRLQGGQIAEHWDAIQDQPATTLNGHALMDGPVTIDDIERTETNKAVASEFYQYVFINKQFETLPNFVDPDLIQHQPEIADGLIGLQTYLRQQSSRFSVEQMSRIIAEGNFVVIQSIGRWEQRPATFYDVFRLKEGKIAERWGLKQVVP